MQKCDKCDDAAILRQDYVWWCAECWVKFFKKGGVDAEVSGNRKGAGNRRSY
jgi:ribosomal protein L37AE/L43A